MDPPDPCVNWLDHHIRGELLDANLHVHSQRLQCSVDRLLNVTINLLCGEKESKDGGDGWEGTQLISTKLKITLISASSTSPVLVILSLNTVIGSLDLRTSCTSSRDR